MKRMLAALALPLLAASAATASDATDDFHAGAQVGLISLVRPLNVEVLAKTRLFGAGLEYSTFPGFISDPLLDLAGAKKGSTTATLDDFSALNADLRVYPFSGSFFLGAALGRQHLKATVTDTSTGSPQTATADVTTWFVTPRLGWLWLMDSGVSLGLDLGVQLKLSADKNVVVPASAPPDLKTNVNNLVDLAAGIPLPSVNFRIGYLF